MKKVFIVYDGRACGGKDPSECTVMTVCNTLAEAKNEAVEYGETAIFSYDDDNGTLINEKWECDVR